MATRFIWSAEGGYSFPSSNIPLIDQESTTRHYYWAFNDATDQTIYLPGIVPQGGFTGTVTLVAFGYMASATTNNVVGKAAVEAVTPGDALDLDTNTSFDSFNTSSATAVPGTAGHEFTVSITMTNVDSWAAGDAFRIEFGRDADNASDNASGNWKVRRVELRDTA